VRLESAGVRKINSENKTNLQEKKQNIDEEAYVVESIVGWELIDNEHLYEVKWKGWSSNTNTWEPSENLTNCEPRSATTL